MIDDSMEFEDDKRRWAEAMSADETLRGLATEMLVRADHYQYAYQWTWLGLPIIQLSTDILAQQEIIWRTRPQLIIETGVARGGSMIFLASLLQLIGEGEVIGIDVDIRPHNRKRIESHELASRISLIEGSSVESAVVETVARAAMDVERVMVILDSNHTHDHVLKELRCYAPLVTVGQYLVVADTVIEYQPPQTHRPRPWGPGNSPMSALKEFLGETERFVPDQELRNKMLYSASPGGYLRCVG